LPAPRGGKKRFSQRCSLSEALRVSGVIIDLDDRIRRLAADESRERSLIASLAPWDALDVPLGCTGTVTTAVLLGTVPAAVELGALKERVCAVCPESEVFVVSSDKTQHYLEIICLKSAVAEVTARCASLPAPWALLGIPAPRRKHRRRRDPFGEMGWQRRRSRRKSRPLRRR
jgi:hypothetical protein